MTEEVELSGNVIKTSVSLPPYLYEWLQEVVKSNKQKFPSYSSVVVIALAELKGKMDYKNQIKVTTKEERSNFDTYLDAYFQTDAGKKYLKSLEKTEGVKDTIFEGDPKKEKRIYYVE